MPLNHRVINVLTIHFTRIACLCLVLGAMADTAAAASIDRSPEVVFFAAADESRFETSQSNCMSLSQAVESVRRRGNVERVISAQTRVSGGREVHHIKVLTKDGKVRTHTVNGCKR